MASDHSSITMGGFARDFSIKGLLVDWAIGLAILALTILFGGSLQALPGYVPDSAFAAILGYQLFFIAAILAFLVILFGPFFMESQWVQAIGDLFFSFNKNAMRSAIAVVAAIALALFSTALLGLNETGLAFAAAAFFFFALPLTGLLFPASMAAPFANRASEKNLAVGGALKKIMIVSDSGIKNVFSKTALASMLVAGLLCMAAAIYLWGLALFGIAILAGFFQNASAKKIKAIELNEGGITVTEFGKPQKSLGLACIGRIMAASYRKDLTLVTISKKKFPYSWISGFVKKDFSEVKQKFSDCAFLEGKEMSIGKKVLRVIFNIKPAGNQA